MLLNLSSTFVFSLLFSIDKLRASALAWAMSKETKDIPPIPTILAGPPASPLAFIPKINPKQKAAIENDNTHSLDASRYSNGYSLPRLTFVCLSCNIRVTIQPVIVPITFDKVFCPLCRTLYAYATQDCLPKGHEYGPIAIDESHSLPVGTIKQIIADGQKINDRHNAIDLLYQMRYTCQCVGPMPENGWCKHCKRLLQDE